MSSYDDLLINGNLKTMYQTDNVCSIQDGVSGAFGVESLVWIVTTVENNVVGVNLFYLTSG